MKQSRPVSGMIQHSSYLNAGCDQTIHDSRRLVMSAWHTCTCGRHFQGRRAVLGGIEPEFVSFVFIDCAGIQKVLTIATE